VPDATALDLAFQDFGDPQAAGGGAECFEAFGLAAFEGRDAVAVDEKLSDFLAFGDGGFEIGLTTGKFFEENGPQFFDLSFSLHSPTRVFPDFCENPDGGGTQPGVRRRGFGAIRLRVLPVPDFIVGRNAFGDRIFSGCSRKNREKKVEKAGYAGRFHSGFRFGGGSGRMGLVGAGGFVFHLPSSKQ
jgi:hypothetical protein